MNIILNTTGYKAKRLVVADVVLQPNLFETRLKELSGRLTAKTKDYYNSFFKDAIAQVQMELKEKVEREGFDGVTNLKVTPFMKELRSDVFIGAVAQCIGLVREEVKGVKKNG